LCCFKTQLNFSSNLFRYKAFLINFDEIILE
jgi:hypothetical protein